MVWENTLESWWEGEERGPGRSHLWRVVTLSPTELEGEFEAVLGGGLDAKLLRKMRAEIVSSEGHLVKGGRFQEPLKMSGVHIIIGHVVGNI